MDVKRTEAPQQESVDKVDNIVTPEMITLFAHDRRDMTILMPWASYCQCMELLRTNSRGERLYYDIAQQVGG